MPETKLLLRNAAAVLPDRIAEGKDIFIKNGLISDILDDFPIEQVNREQVIDLDGLKLFAGFIDVHNHGAIGVDVNAAASGDLREVGGFLAQNGVTAWLPTFVPDADATYQKVIGAIEELLKIQADLPIAQIVGVHYEGVFANAQMCGALRPEFFKTFSGDELENLPTLANGVHLTTFAPEIAGGIELIKELKKQNWIPSIGHTKADFETLEKAFEAGARHLTHFFNAMTGLHHRDVGVVGWAFGRNDVTCDIIADGVHVAPQILRLAHNFKTAENLMLISDSVAPTGLGDGTFELWGEKISVAGGRTQNERGSIAGSVITMLDAVKMYLSLGVSETEVSTMASANPARLLGLEKTHGSIEIGKRADLVAFAEQGNIKLCLIGGKVVVDKNSIQTG